MAIRRRPNDFGYLLISTMPTRNASCKANGTDDDVGRVGSRSMLESIKPDGHTHLIHVFEEPHWLDESGLCPHTWSRV